MNATLMNFPFTSQVMSFLSSPLSWIPSLPSLLCHILDAQYSNCEHKCCVEKLASLILPFIIINGVPLQTTIWACNAQSHLLQWWWRCSCKVTVRCSISVHANIRGRRRRMCFTLSLFLVQLVAVGYIMAADSVWVSNILRICALWM